MPAPNPMTSASTRWVERLLADGYCVIPNIVPAETIAALDAGLEPDFAETPFCKGGFYGQRTKRFGRLLVRSPIAQSLVMHPLVLAIAREVLSPWCDTLQLNLTQAVAIHPGAAAQLPHRDQDMWRGAVGETEYLVNVMWPFTPYRRDNGATLVWPDSHGPRALDPSVPPTETAVEMDPSSALLFLGSTLHGAGANRSDEVRRGAIVSMFSTSGSYRTASREEAGRGRQALQQTARRASSARLPLRRALRPVLVTSTGSAASRKADNPPDGAVPCDSPATPTVVELETLYRSELPKLVRSLARRTDTREDALDVAQEAFSRMARLGQRLACVERPDHYLRRIATNLIRDQARGADRRPAALTTTVDELQLEGDDPHRLLEARDTLRRLEAALLKLKPRTRAIFIAHRVNGMSYAEIARQTGMTTKGVEKQMSKAIATLDRLLDRSAR